MYTAPTARGRGVARRMLAAVEESARAHGRRRMILETGDKQPEAIALYNSSGYERIDNFGYYRDEPGVLLLRPACSDLDAAGASPADRVPAQSRPGRSGLGVAHGRSRRVLEPGGYGETVGSRWLPR